MVLMIAIKATINRARTVPGAFNVYIQSSHRHCCICDVSVPREAPAELRPPCLLNPQTSSLALRRKQRGDRTGPRPHAKKNGTKIQTQGGSWDVCTYTGV
jgi:hypothetical protein